MRIRAVWWRAPRQEILRRLRFRRRVPRAEALLEQWLNLLERGVTHDQHHRVVGTNPSFVERGEPALVRLLTAASLPLPGEGVE
jgi:hypothetical protein